MPLLWKPNNYLVSDLNLIFHSPRSRLVQPMRISIAMTLVEKIVSVAMRACGALGVRISLQKERYRMEMVGMEICSLRGADSHFANARKGVSYRTREAVGIGKKAREEPQVSEFN
jgi:hypothetical protein